VLEFATVEGARANGLGRKVGTLTPGKEADIIMLRTDRLNVMPMNNAVGAVVTSMTAQNVDTVLIAGKVVKRNGKLVGVDMNRIAKLGRDAQARNYKASNVPDKRI
jgi:5-methylthioadenosine/S-adenosylhomocysteine deaminase